MTRRRLTGAVFALAVLGVPGVAHAGDDPPDGKIRCGPANRQCFFDVH